MIVLEGKFSEYGRGWPGEVKFIVVGFVEFCCVYCNAFGILDRAGS